MERPAQNKHALQWRGTEGLFHMFGQDLADLAELINTTIAGEPSIVFKRHAGVSLTSLRTPDYGCEALAYCALVGFDANSGSEYTLDTEASFGGYGPRHSSAFYWTVGLRGGCEGVEIPVACWQQALCTIVPMPLACGRLSFGHGHGLPVPRWPFSWSRLSRVCGHVIPYDRQGQIGERQETQILKFNSPTPYTLSLQCPSNRKFSQLSYEPGCSRELWCRKCATWLWNKYVLIFSKTLFYTHTQRHTAAAGTKSYKTM